MLFSCVFCEGVLSMFIIITIIVVIIMIIIIIIFILLIIMYIFNKYPQICGIQ